MNILVVVDMQNDFIDGSLGTEEAQRIVPEVVKKIQTFVWNCVCDKRYPRRELSGDGRRKKTSGQTLYPWNRRLADQTGDLRSSDRGAC